MSRGSTRRIFNSSRGFQASSFKASVSPRSLRIWSVVPDSSSTCLFDSSKAPSSSLLGLWEDFLSHRESRSTSPYRRFVPMMKTTPLKPYGRRDRRYEQCRKCLCGWIARRFSHCLHSGRCVYYAGGTAVQVAGGGSFVVKLKCTFI